MPKKPSLTTHSATDPRFDFQTHSLGYALRRAQMRAYDLFFQMLGPLDLSPARLTALSLVAMNHDMNQAKLAKQLDIAGPSALKLVDALEGAGLIARTAVAGDRRRYCLVVTDAGLQLLERARVELQVYEARLASKLTTEEQAQLVTVLERIAT